MVDTRDDQIRFLVQESRNGEVNAVGRGTLDVVVAIAQFMGAQGPGQRQGIAGTTAVAVRCDNGDRTKLDQVLGEDEQPGGLIAIVITEKDTHTRALSRKPGHHTGIGQFPHGLRVAAGTEWSRRA